MNDAIPAIMTLDIKIIEWGENEPTWSVRIEVPADTTLYALHIMIQQLVYLTMIIFVSSSQAERGEARVLYSASRFLLSNPTKARRPPLRKSFRYRKGTNSTTTSISGTIGCSKSHTVLVRSSRMQGGSSRAS
jgi:hypothetical protein